MWFTAVLSSAHASDGHNLGLEAKFDMLSAQIRHLENQNDELAMQNSDMGKQISELAKQNLELKEKDSNMEREIANMQTKAGSSTSLMFDCYLTENWSEAGPIRFNGCTGKDKSLYSIP